MSGRGRISKSVIDAYPCQQQGGSFLFYWEAALDGDFLDTDGDDDEHDDRYHFLTTCCAQPSLPTRLCRCEVGVSLLFLHNSDLNLGLSLEASQVAQW